jgi:hypothetical protein
MYFLFFFLLSLIASPSLNANSNDAFKPYVNLFAKNEHMYAHYLSTSGDLSKLGRLHLWALRFLIDTRLGLESDSYHDCVEIHNTVDGDEYLEKEFITRYIFPEDHP